MPDSLSFDFEQNEKKPLAGIHREGLSGLLHVRHSGPCLTAYRRWS